MYAISVDTLHFLQSSVNSYFETGVRLFNATIGVHRCKKLSTPPRGVYLTFVLGGSENIRLESDTNSKEVILDNGVVVSPLERNLDQRTFQTGIRPTNISNGHFMPV